MKHTLKLLAVIPVLAIGLIVATPSSTQAATYNSNPTLAAYEKRAFTLVNIHRTGKGLKPLVWNDTAAKLARSHSANMASGYVPFGHTYFMKRANKIYAAIPNARGVGENVAYTNQSDPAKRAYGLWKNSSSHRSTIEKSTYTLSGMGAAKKGGRVYFTQLFVSVR